MRWLVTAALVGAFWLGGCGREAGEGAGQGKAEPAPAAQAPSAQAPVSVTAGAIDQALADQGQSLLQARGCTACHTMGGGRLVGPDLSGVSERRSPDWIIAMIVNPDSMLVNDETAKKLLGEYFTPMANQGVTRDDARALLEFFRRSDSAAQ
jgi:mono/diheme cytochrome c family protein